ncbi:MAG: histidine kinase [Cytophagaceae bacterium]|jgi:LytS/YehU family sensor histidine kinase|nr:histidine kinase [Cytophagaceae bacterium]
MNRSIPIFLQVGFWLSYAVLVFIILGVYYRTSNDEQVGALVFNAFSTIFLFALLPSALAFYSCYLFVFPVYLKRKKYGWALMSGLLVSMLAATICYAMLRYSIQTGWIIDLDKRGTSTVTEVIIFMTLIAMLAGIVALVIRGFIAWMEEVRWKELLQQKNHEMELALVKAQLDPHFLFNTLNNIDMLIVKNPTLASLYLSKLSDILRFMLYETKNEMVSLEKELSYIEKYLELQKIRTLNDSYVKWSVLGNSDGRKIVPLLFIPFIENAFKHSVNKKIENAILISVQILEGSIIFSCENYFDPYRSQSKENGIGDDLIKKRLELLYPGQYQLRKNVKGHTYQVVLSIYE